MVPGISNQEAARLIDDLYRAFATLTARHEVISNYLVASKADALKAWEAAHADEIAQARQLADDAAESENRLRVTAHDYAVETHEQRLHPEVLVKITQKIPAYEQGDYIYHQLVDWFLRNPAKYEDLMTINRARVSKVASSSERPDDFPVQGSDDYTVNIGRKYVADYAEAANDAHSGTE